MLALKRKSPVLDPYYRPGFMPVAKVRAMMDKFKDVPVLTPRPRPKRTSPLRSLNLPTQRTSSGATSQAGVLV